MSEAAKLNTPKDRHNFIVGLQQEGCPKASIRMGTKRCFHPGYWFGTGAHRITTEVWTGQQQRSFGQFFEFEQAYPWESVHVSAVAACGRKRTISVSTADAARQ